MAKTRTKKKTSGQKRKGTRRHKVGAMALNPASPMVQIGSAAIGFLMGDKINTALAKLTGTIDGKIVGGAEAGIGAALMFMKFGPKKSLPEVIAGGVIGGAGVKKLLQEFGVINGIGGYQSLPVIAAAARGKAHLNGYSNVPAIAGNGSGGYRTSRSAMNGTGGGFTTSRAPMNVSNQVMGGMNSGSGYNSGDGGSSYMG